jgi:hypothetical protein
MASEVLLFATHNDVRKNVFSLFSRRWESRRAGGCAHKPDFEVDGQGRSWEVVLTFQTRQEVTRSSVRSQARSSGHGFRAGSVQTLRVHANRRADASLSISLLGTSVFSVVGIFGYMRTADQRILRRSHFRRARPKRDNPVGHPPTGRERSFARKSSIRISRSRHDHGSVTVDKLAFPTTVSGSTGKA